MIKFECARTYVVQCPKPRQPWEDGRPFGIVLEDAEPGPKVFDVDRNSPAWERVPIHSTLVQVGDTKLYYAKAEQWVKAVQENLDKERTTLVFEVYGRILRPRRKNQETNQNGERS